MTKIPTRLRILSLLILTAVALLGSPTRSHAQKNSAKAKDGKIEAFPVQGNVYMIVGAGANITVQVGEEALLVVNTGATGRGKDVLAAIRTISDKPVSYIVDTSGDEDVIGGNHDVGEGGSFAPYVQAGTSGERTGASVMAYIDVLKRMSVPSGKTPVISEELWPSDTYDTPDWRLFNNEGVIIEHMPAAHTDGDSIVFFRRSDVVSTGAIFDPERFPIIDLARGGSINGTIDALNHIVDDLLITKFGEEAGTYVIPGHGRLCDRTDIVNYRDMVTIIRDRIQDLLNKGMTLEQVKAAKPALGFDTLYGDGDKSPATQNFVETIYRDLSKGKTKQGQ
jgi:glyoxylase-like metal-dependent hydrolase (beta-lactamase superfamily II)